MMMMTMTMMVKMMMMMMVMTAEMIKMIITKRAFLENDE